MMDGHGNGRSKRSGTIWNGTERFGTIWNEVKNLVTGRSRDGHGHVTFSAINERFTVKNQSDFLHKTDIQSITVS